MGKFNDITGQRFGRLVVTKRGLDKKLHSGRTLITWECLCDCGNTHVVESKRLSSGATKSCGCLKREVTSNLNKKYTQLNNRIYRIYIGMKNRCYSEKNHDFNNYGGRGIEICEEWLSDYELFQSWSIANGYDENSSIDRIDNDKGYSPSNCRWTSMKEQANNRNNNIMVTINGDNMTLAECCDLYKNISYTKYQKLNAKNINISELIELEINK